MNQETWTGSRPQSVKQRDLGALGAQLTGLEGVGRGRDHLRRVRRFIVGAPPGGSRSTEIKRRNSMAMGAERGTRAFSSSTPHADG